MGYSNPEEQREYQRRWMQARREWAIGYLGGTCAECGSVFDLQFDHIDPLDKTLKIGQLLSCSKDKLILELNKCQLLCQPCHVAKTVTNRDQGQDTPAAHGVYGYRKGCRCGVCRDAVAAVATDWRAARKEMGYVR